MLSLSRSNALAAALVVLVVVVVLLEGVVVVVVIVVADQAERCLVNLGPFSRNACLLEGSEHPKSTQLSVLPGEPSDWRCACRD